MSTEPAVATSSAPVAHLQLPPGRWVLVPSRSWAEFTVRNWGLVNVRGRVPVLRGEVQLGEDGAVGQVHAELALAGLDTHNAKRDRDLAKPSLLDLARHPVLRFDGGLVEQGPSGLALPGLVSAHGATVPVRLSVDVGDVEDRRLTVRAATELDRRDLGIRAPQVMIGHRIDVEVSACFELRS
jgi:polyisoprenoid-binding protein YceI